MAQTYSEILCRCNSMHLCFERTFESNISYNLILEALNHLVCFSTIFKYSCVENAIQKNPKRHLKLLDLKS